MSHSLTTLAAYLEGIRAGEIPLWNEAVFGGYSLVALAYQYPNPVALIAAVLGVSDVYSFAGYEAAVLLCLAGWSAYAFLRTSSRTRIAAVAGAVLYQTCALSILKIGQNDMSFLAIVLLPLLLLGIKTLARTPGIGAYLGVTVVASLLLNFSFLQKVAYVGLLATAYAIWLSREQRSWRPLLLSSLGAAPALISAIPRIITVAEDFAVGNRTSGPPLGIAELYAATSFSKVEILRWFDERIFGDGFSEMAVLGNHYNVHEGFLLYMTAFAPFLLLYAVLKRLPWRLGDADAKFSFYVCAFAFTCVFTATGYWLLWRTFFRVDFIHFRILLIAILPACLLIALVIDSLEDRSPVSNPGLLRKKPVWIIGLTTFATLIVVELIAQIANANGMHTPEIHGHRAQGGAVLRIFLSTGLLILLWRLKYSGTISGKQAQVSLAVMLITQATAFAALTVWGPGRWEYPTAFKTGTRAFAHLGEFKTPSNEARTDIRSRLQADSYRTSFICPTDQVGVFCPTQIANFWHLRSIDGYVSTVPIRLARLPFGPNVSGRVITFFKEDQLNWPLLGLLNVRYAIDFRPELFTNAVRTSSEKYRELRSTDLVVHENPMPVAPRAFFASSVTSAPDMAAAITWLFPRGVSRDEGYDPVRTSVAEGLPADGVYPTDGKLSAVFKWHRATVSVSPHSQPRFLVLNELFEKNWVARDESDHPLPIYPTNVFMRGVIVPARVTQIEFEYRPFMARPIAYIFYAGGLLLALFGAMLIAKLANRKSVLSVQPQEMSSKAAQP